MLRSMLVILALALTIVSPAQSAEPERLCGERGKILGQLANKYQEQPQAIGILADGGLLEIVASPTGSWTILVSYPKGPSCILAVGSSWSLKNVLVGRAA